MSHRVCFALDLVNDAALIAEYEALHAPGKVWPGVIAGIRAAGYESMEIWRVGDRLFMIADVADEWPRPIAPELQAVDILWQDKMDEFQSRLAVASPDEKWTPMDRIFSLDEH